MKKKLLKPAVLVLVFILSLIISSILTNRSNEDLTTTMAEAGLPVITFTDGGKIINELHGYTREMNIPDMRDSIVPVGKDRKLNMVITEGAGKFSTISYAVRSLDGKRLVADGKIEDFEENDGRITLEIQLQNILEEDQEYMMVISLKEGEDIINYYSRVMETSDLHAKECMDFAYKFHEYSLREDANKFIPTYMDPATGDTTTLQYVDLSCTLRQITWADFEGRVVGEPSGFFKEINSSYNVVTLQYVMTSVSSSGETEYYNVEEYYRLRYTKARMYVLNFERRMNELFRGENSFANESKNILLGIREQNVEYKSSGNFIAFVQEGELWCCHPKENTMIRVFSFLDAEGIGQRENWNRHDIKIIRMDEAGSIDFVVCGYMNRGEHEGQVGLSICHYDGLSQTIEEEAFLPSKRSYEILKAQMGQLMYENETGEIFVMVEGTVYEINLETLAVTPKIKNLGEGCYAVSGSNRYFAWVASDKQYKSRRIHLWDFQNNKQTDIREEQMYLRPLGFLGDDFIYGGASGADVSISASGETLFPMKIIKIMHLSDTGYEVEKEYSPDGRFIRGINVSDETIEVDLMKKKDGQLVPVSGDSIMNRQQDEKDKVQVKTIVTEGKQTQVVICQSAEISDEAKNRMITPRTVVADSKRTIDLEAETGKGYFYVYQKGQVLLSSAKLSEAIAVASEKNGVVVNSSQKLIWMRTGKKAQIAFTDIPSVSGDGGTTYVRCLVSMIQGAGMEAGVSDISADKKNAYQILKERLKNKTVLELSGCKTEDLVYYIGNHIPVLAMTDQNSAVLLTGYGGGQVNYYDMGDGATHSLSYKECDKKFQKAGNIFYSYLP